MSKLLDGVAGVVNEPRSEAPVRIGGGICVFSPKLNKLIPFDRMLLMIAELGGVALTNRLRPLAAFAALADSIRATATASMACCKADSRNMAAEGLSTMLRFFDRC